MSEALMLGHEFALGIDCPRRHIHEDVICRKCATCGKTEADHYVQQKQVYIPASLPRRGDVSLWFELTYASYLTIPRSILEDMPDEWQQRFYLLFAELNERYTSWPPSGQHYEVRLRNERGRYCSDALQAYRHPDQQALASIRKASR